MQLANGQSPNDSNILDQLRQPAVQPPTNAAIVGQAVDSALTPPTPMTPPTSGGALAGVAQSAADLAKQGQMGVPVQASYTSPAPPGFDPAKWADSSKSDPKYDIGHIIDANGAGALRGKLDTVIGQIQQKYPGASVVSGDKIAVPGYGTIDVINSSGTTQWQPDQPDGGSAQAAPAAPAASAQFPNLMAGGPGQSAIPMNWDTYQQLQQRIAQILQGGSPSDVVNQATQSLLGNG